MPFDLWQRALAREYVLLVSPAIIRELADVLRSGATAEVLGHRVMAPSTLGTFLRKLVVRVAKVVEPRATIQAIKADPDDDRILECALAGGADLIVSGDHHLTRLKNFEGIAIVRPVYFLKTLG